MVPPSVTSTTTVTVSNVSVSPLSSLIPTWSSNRGLIHTRACSKQFHYTLTVYLIILLWSTTSIYIFFLDWRGHLYRVQPLLGQSNLMLVHCWYYCIKFPFDRLPWKSTSSDDGQLATACQIGGLSLSEGASSYTNTKRVGVEQFLDIAFEISECCRVLTGSSKWINMECNEETSSSLSADRLPKSCLNSLHFYGQHLPKLSLDCGRGKLGRSRCNSSAKSERGTRVSTSIGRVYKRCSKQ